jgi:hypothetical protein
MRQNGWLTGYGMATARYDVPAVERSHATLPAVLWARSCLRPEAPIVPEITSIVRRPLTGRHTIEVRIHLTRRGHPCMSL